MSGLSARSVTFWWKFLLKGYKNCPKFDGI